MVECSGSTTIERVETAMLSPLSSAPSRSGVGNVPWAESGHMGRTYDSHEHRDQDIKEIRREKVEGSEQRRWMACRQQEFGGRSDLRRFESFSPTRDDHTSANFVLDRRS
jgi:hypothetical protein